MYCVPQGELKAFLYQAGNFKYLNNLHMDSEMLQAYFQQHDTQSIESKQKMTTKPKPDKVRSFYCPGNCYEI